MGIYVIAAFTGIYSFFMYRLGFYIGKNHNENRDLEKEVTAMQVEIEAFLTEATDNKIGIKRGKA